MKKPNRRTVDLALAFVFSLAAVIGVRVVDHLGRDTIEVTVEFTAPERGSEFISLEPSSATIEIAGSSRVRAAVQSDRTQRPSLTLPIHAFDGRPDVIDLLELDNGTGGRSRRWLRRELQLPLGARIEGTRPREIEVSYRALTEREVPVEVDFVGSLPERKELGGYTVDPPTIRVLAIEGHPSPRALVGPVNREQLNEDISFTLSVLPLDSSGGVARFADEKPPTVTVGVTVVDQRDTTSLRNVPVQLIGATLEGYGFFPQELTVRVRCDAGVTCDPELIRDNVFAAVELSRLDSEQQLQLATPVVLNLPDGVQLDSETPLTVAVTLPVEPPAQPPDPSNESPAAP